MHISGASLAALCTLVVPSVAQVPQIPFGNPLLAPRFESPPLLGFGTWNLRESAENTTKSVKHAISTGYRHIDCAAAYSNQKDVGSGIAQGLQSVTGLTRNDLWITSKLWNDHHGLYENVERGLNETLAELGLDYLDLYLMHWPVGNPDGTYAYDFVETWASMTRLLSTGRVRNIGISNFSPSQLDTLLKSSSVGPFAHQMELHPYLQQEDWVKFHHENNIHVTAYSPLGNMNPTYGSRASGKSSHEKPPLLLDNGYLKKIAHKRNATVAQVALAWNMHRGVSVIPKSKHESLIEENFGALEVELRKKDRKRIRKMGKRYLTRFNNPSEDWGVELFEGLDGA